MLKLKAKKIKLLSPSDALPNEVTSAVGAGNSAKDFQGFTDGCTAKKTFQ